MKYLVLQADGMADEPCPELDGKTPLDAARTPHLDQMASRGILGLTRTIPRGLPPGSDVGTLSVLGYDPTRYHTGGAGLEAAGMGVPLGPEDVAFRLSLVTLETPEEGGTVMRNAAAGQPTCDETRALLADLTRELTRGDVEVRPGSGARHLLVWRRGERRMRTTAPHDLTDRPIAGKLPEGPGADVLRDLMERGRGVLAAHPICLARRERGAPAPNAVWLWGPATRPMLPTLCERFGVAGSVVAAAPLAAGLGMLAGLERVRVPGATGSFDTDYRAKADHGLRALGEREFLFLHVQAPDEGGRLGDAIKKTEAIERLDAELLGPMLDGLSAAGGEWRVLVMPDHPTPCTLKAPTAEPVPFVVYVSTDEQKPRGQSRGYNERDARDQGIFIPEAHTLLERLLRT